MSKNVYYDPEHFGLKILGELELTEPCWSFDTVAVWQHLETGKVYYAHDSGCSCPGEFEDYNDIHSLTELGPNWDDLARFIESRILNFGGRRHPDYVSIPEVIQFVNDMEKEAAAS